MNKKGFTLVEILAVIVILSLIITITATKGFGAFDNTKNKITEQNKKAIEEAAKLFLTDVDNCDDDLEEYKELNNILKIDNVDNCTQLKEGLVGQKEIDLNDLKNSGYVSGNDLEELKGTITLEFDDKGNGNKNNIIINVINVNDYTIKNYTFTSNNKGIANTTATTTLQFTTTSDGKLNFNYFVSSESDSFDYLTITLQKDSGSAETILNKTGGENKTGAISKDLVNGSAYKLTFNYRKDGSVDKYEDTAKISNLNITSKLNGELNIKNGEYYFKKN